MWYDCTYIVVSCCGKTDIFVCENRGLEKEWNERRLKFSPTREDTCLNSPAADAAHTHVQHATIKLLPLEGPLESNAKESLLKSLDIFQNAII